MKSVSILVPQTEVMAGITDPKYMFTAMNEFLKAEDKPQLFNVQ